MTSLKLARFLSARQVKVFFHIYIELAFLKRTFFEYTIYLFLEIYKRNFYLLIPV